MKSIRDYNAFFSFSKLSIVYFAVSILLVRIHPNPVVMIFVTSVSIILIPLLVGKSIIAIIHKNHRNDYYSAISSAVVEWLAGNLFIYFSASFLFLFNLLEPKVYTFLIITLPIIYLTVRELKKGNTKENESFTKSIDKIFGSKFVIPFIFVAGLLPLYYLIPIQPFPLSPTQTGGRLRLSLMFIDEGYIELVRGYSALLSVIHSLSAIIYDLYPLQVLSATAYLSHVVFPFALYLLSYKVTRDPLISLVPAFIGPWFFLMGNINLTALENTNLLFHIFTWMLYVELDYRDSSLLIYKNLPKKTFLLSLMIVFLYPVTFFIGKGGKVIAPNYFIFLSVVLPTFLISIYCTLNKNNDRNMGFLITFVLPFTLITITHPFLGLMLVFFLICYAYSLSVSSKQIKRLKLFTLFLTAIVLIIGLSGINSTDNFIFSKYFFGDLFSKAGGLNTEQKWSSFLEWGPSFAIFLYFLSVFLISAIGDREYVSFAFISSIILFIAFLPEEFFWRSPSYLNPLAAVMLTCLLLLPLDMMEIKVEIKGRLLNSLVELRNPLSKLNHSVTLKSFFVIMILLILMPIVQVPRAQYFEGWVSTSGEGYHSHFQTYDIEVSFWISDNFRYERVLIISDPATMYFVGSLTAKDTLMTEYIDPYMPWEYSNETWSRMEQLKEKVFSSFGEEESYDRIENISSSVYPQFRSYSKVFVIITPHTYYWLEGLIFPTKVKKIPIDTLAVVSNLDKDNAFSLVYEIDKVLYVYELRMR